MFPTEGFHIVKPWRDNYSDDEVRTVTEEREELDGSRHKTFILVRLMDIDRAWHNLPPREKEAVLLVGMLQLPLRQAANLLSASHQTVWRRYNRGLEYMAHYLNGG